jgi:hypothetical protein
LQDHSKHRKEILKISFKPDKTKKNKEELILLFKNKKDLHLDYNGAYMVIA